MACYPMGRQAGIHVSWMAGGRAGVQAGRRAGNQRLQQTDCIGGRWKSDGFSRHLPVGLGKCCSLAFCSFLLIDVVLQDTNTTRVH